MEQIGTTDIILKCVDCNGNYILGVGEREFYISQDLRLPRRCPSCRARRRQEGQTGGNRQSEGSNGLP